LAPAGNHFFITIIIIDWIDGTNLEREKKYFLFLACMQHWMAAASAFTHHGTGIIGNHRERKVLLAFCFEASQPAIVAVLIPSIAKRAPFQHGFLEEIVV